jgi:16S rRNA processing protein RimM
MHQHLSPKPLLRKHRLRNRWLNRLLNKRNVGAMTPDDRLIEIAAIIGVHGLQGEVRLRVHSGDIGSLKRNQSVRLEPLGKLVTLTAVIPDAKGVRARLSGYPDRTAVEPLRGQKLMVERAALPPPADDEVYLADLIGLPVETVDGLPVGRVIATPNYGAGDLLDIEKPDGSTVLVPLQPVAVPLVDVAAKLIRVEPGFVAP